MGVFTWLSLSFTNPWAAMPLIFPAIPALFTVYAFRQIRNGLVPADAWRTALSLCAWRCPGSTHNHS